MKGLFPSGLVHLTVQVDQLRRNNVPDVFSKELSQLFNLRVLEKHFKYESLENFRMLNQVARRRNLRRYLLNIEKKNWNLPCLTNYDNASKKLSLLERSLLTQVTYLHRFEHLRGLCRPFVETFLMTLAP